MLAVRPDLLCLLAQLMRIIIPPVALTLTSSDSGIYSGLVRAIKVLPSEARATDERAARERFGKAAPPLL